MKNYFLLGCVLFTAACTTPMTTLRHSSTGQVATCGGNVGSSLAGGAIGYQIQKSNDKDCIINYQSQGFKVVNQTANAASSQPPQKSK